MAVSPLPNRALPFLDGPHVALPWYRWFQQRPDNGAPGTPGADGQPGAPGAPGPAADDFLSLVSLGLQDQSGILSVTSTSGDLTVSGGGSSNIRLTVVSAPKWDTPRTESFTGDATGGPTSVDGSANWSTALTLATVNASPGTFGDATHVAQVTVNAKGLVTSAASVAITPLVSFGSGAPSALVAEGALYFDTSASPYNAYVQHSSAWHAFT